MRTGAGRAGRVSAGFYIGSTITGSIRARHRFIANWDALAERLSGPVLVGGEIDPAGRERLAGLGSSVLLSDPAQSAAPAGFLAQMAEARLAAGQVDNPATLAPIYLR